MEDISLEEWKRVQEHEAGWWSRTIKRPLFEKNQTVWHQFVLDHFGIKDSTDFKDEVLVDIGSAYSGILTHLKAKERIVVDPLSFKTLDKELIRIKAPGEEIPLEDGYANKVFMYNVLQHVRSPSKVLSEGLRILKEGGTFYILEQLNLPIGEAHPHSLKMELFDKWIKKSALMVVKKDIKENSWLHPAKTAKDPSWMKLCLIIKKKNEQAQ